MGISTVFAVHTHDGKRENFISKLNFPSVKVITNETAGVSIGTRNKVQIKEFIVFTIKALIKLLSYTINFKENRKEKHNKNAKYGWYRYDVRFCPPRL